MQLKKAIIGLIIALLLVGCARIGYVPLDSSDIDLKKQKEFAEADVEDQIEMAEIPDRDEIKLRKIKTKKGFSRKRAKQKESKALSWKKWPPKKEKISLRQRIKNLFSRKNK